MYVSCLLCVACQMPSKRGLKNLAGIHQSVRVENLLDEDYEQIFSFRSPGIGAYAGLRLSWGPGSR